LIVNKSTTCSKLTHLLPLGARRPSGHTRASRTAWFGGTDIKISWCDVLCLAVYRNTVHVFD